MASLRRAGVDNLGDAPPPPSFKNAASRRRAGTRRRADRCASCRGADPGAAGQFRLAHPRHAGGVLARGTLAAVVVEKTCAPGRKWLRRALVGLLLVPLCVQAAAWQTALGLGGWLASEGQMPWLSGWRGAVWVHGLAGVPWVAVIVGAALRTVDRHLEEAALQDSSPGTVVRRISLRAAMPAVAAAALWVASICATENLGHRFLPGPHVRRRGLHPGQSRGTRRGGAGRPALGHGLALRRRSLQRGVGSVPPLRGGRPGGGRVAGADRLRRPGQPVAVGFASRAVGRGACGAGDRWSGRRRPGREPLRQGRREGREDRRRLRPHLVGRGSRKARRGEPLRAPPRTGLVGGHRGHCGNARHRACRRACLGGPDPAHPSVSPALLAALLLAVPPPIVGVWVIHLLNQPEGSPLAWLTWCYDHTVLAPVLVQSARVLPVALVVVWLQLRTSRRTLWPAPPPTARGGGRCC